MNVHVLLLKVNCNNDGSQKLPAMQKIKNLLPKDRFPQFIEYLKKNIRMPELKNIKNNSLIKHLAKFLSNIKLMRIHIEFNGKMYSTHSIEMIEVYLKSLFQNMRKNKKMATKT